MESTIDRPAPILPSGERSPSALALRSAALDALMALGCDYMTAARAVGACVRRAEQMERN